VNWRSRSVSPLGPITGELNLLDVPLILASRVASEKAGCTSKRKSDDRDGNIRRVAANDDRSDKGNGERENAREQPQSPRRSRAGWWWPRRPS